MWHCRPEGGQCHNTMSITKMKWRRHVLSKRGLTHPINTVYVWPHFSFSRDDFPSVWCPSKSAGSVQQCSSSVAPVTVPGNGGESPVRDPRSHRQQLLHQWHRDHGPGQEEAEPRAGAGAGGCRGRGQLQRHLRVLAVQLQAEAGRHEATGGRRRGRGRAQSWPPEFRDCPTLASVDIGRSQFQSIHYLWPLLDLPWAVIIGHPPGRDSIGTRSPVKARSSGSVLLSSASFSSLASSVTDVEEIDTYVIPRDFR